MQGEILDGETRRGNATREGGSGDRETARPPPVSTPLGGAPAAANPLPKIQHRNTEMQLCL